TVAAVSAVTALATLTALAATVAAGPAAELPCTSRHQAFLPIFVLVSLIIVRTPTQPRGLRRPGRRSGRGSHGRRGRTPHDRCRPPWPWPPPAHRPCRHGPSCRPPPRGCRPPCWTPRQAYGRSGHRRAARGCAATNA